MYAYGDEIDPLPETVAAVEDIMLEYMGSICSQAHAVSSIRHRTVSTSAHAHQPKLRLDDIKYVLRHDIKKLSRIEELMVLQEDIKRVRSALDMTAGYADTDGEDEGVSRVKRRKKGGNRGKSKGGPTASNPSTTARGSVNRRGASTGGTPLRTRTTSTLEP